MSKEKNKKERRCKGCGKLLIDETLPFCRRCTLSGINNLGKTVAVGLIGAISAVGAVAMANSEAQSHRDKNSGGSV